jgi:hypothetical protein
MIKVDGVFDDAYVGKQQTKFIEEKKSSIKPFLKSPVSKDDFLKYGTSRPQRIVIRATIQHGES